MVTITEAGKSKACRCQILLNADRSFSSMYLLCDDCKTHITRYLFSQNSNMDLFADEIGKLDSVVCTFQNKLRRFVDVVDSAAPGDLVSYAHRMAIADACGAIEFGTFSYIPELYAPELIMKLDNVPIEEIIVENRADSYRAIKH